MLNYKVKLDSNYIKRDEVVWGEKYLSPDLSFVSGVTSQDYHLENLTKIEASIDGKTDLLTIECENVTREGYVIVRNKEYKVSNGTVFIGGKYYYTSTGTITVNDWLVQNYSVRNEYDSETGEFTGKCFVPGVTTSSVTASVSSGVVKLDTIFWIEDGRVNIDGNEYFFDRDEVTQSSKGCLKYFEDGVCLAGNEVTNCEEIEFFPINNACDFIYVTKFKLERDEDRYVVFDNITYINHFYYVLYNEEYYPIEVNSSGQYSCKLGLVKLYETTSDGVIATTDNVKDYEALGDYDARVDMGGGCQLRVEGTVQNSNSGRKLGIYLNDTYENIVVGDILTTRMDMYNSDVITTDTDDDGNIFVVYDGTRYDVVADMMSTVVINDVEYDIKRCDDTNCFVEIDGEEVPMKRDGNTLIRYGYIVSADSAVTASYEIKHYSGVTINGKDYRVLPIYNSDNETLGYITSAEPGVVHRLMVREVIGSSLLVCEPILYDSEFIDGYVDTKILEIVGDIVTNQKDITIFIKNKLFGEREVLPNNGKIFSSSANSTDDFQNVTGTLKLYSNTGYINIPFKLEAGMGINQLIDDTRDRDFVEVEEQKAINPIIDMEKDVYVPKYIDNSDESIEEFLSHIDMESDEEWDEEDLRHSYIGSFTDFKPVTEIQINPHFRTRNLDNWKVNDGYNDSSVSGKTDNWFITDYEPYKTILESGTTEDVEGLLTVSDTLGLLWFTNMDVFYQKTAVGKTFLRLSYYDDINPQKQNLLNTSTVFVNEHDLFKKFIDNSRKNVNDYMLVQEPEEADSAATPSILNKISVMSEYIGVHNKAKARNKVSGYTFMDAKPFDEDKRISSRFTVVNKYATDTSSEGFYIYIFKQYAENLHPKPIYMKVEINHAKIGKTIPFNIPMSWSASTGETEDSPYVYPVRRLELTNSGDVETLKEGIPLSYVYGQGYVPLYAVYDFKNKEYSYIFDDRYVTVEDGLVQLNVFELKVKNNEDGDNTEKTATIDINEGQIIAI